MKKILSMLLVLVLMFSLVSVMATAASKVAGDVNGDGEVNAKDVTVLRRYLAGGYGLTIQEDYSDVNGDGEINAKDVTILRRFLAGGYGIELYVPTTTSDIKPDETPRIPLP